MLVRVKLDKRPEGLLLTSLPTFREVLTLHSQGVAYVLIPDTDHPELDKSPSAKTEETGHGAALIGLDADGHKKWHAHLDDRYQEHKGEYRPEVA